MSYASLGAREMLLTQGSSRSSPSYITALMLGTLNEVMLRPTLPSQSTGLRECVVCETRSQTAQFERSPVLTNTMLLSEQHPHGQQQNKPSDV